MWLFHHFNAHLCQRVFNYIEDQAFSLISPSPLPPPVSLPVCYRSSLLTREGGGEGEGKARRQESLVLNNPLTTVCCKSQQTTENSLDDVIPVDAVMLVFSFSVWREVSDNPGTYRIGSVFIPDQRVIILYMECRPLRSLCDYACVGVLCTFSKISAAASSWVCQ